LSYHVAFIRYINKLPSQMLEIELAYSKKVNNFNSTFNSPIWYNLFLVLAQIF